MKKIISALAIGLTLTTAAHAKQGCGIIDADAHTVIDEMTLESSSKYGIVFKDKFKDYTVKAVFVNADVGEALITIYKNDVRVAAGAGTILTLADATTGKIEVDISCGKD